MKACCLPAYARPHLEGNADAFMSVERRVDWIALLAQCPDELTTADIMPCTVLQVTQLYRERIPEGAVVLDLMSSWVSHLPPEKKYKRVVGHGMNAAEVSISFPGQDAVPSLHQDPRQGLTQDAKMVCKKSAKHHALCMFCSSDRLARR